MLATRLGGGAEKKETAYLPPKTNMYDRLGGMEFFDQLTSGFYARVSNDEVLKPLYPQGSEDLEASREHLCLFLAQFFGGPRVYEERRGSPMLRARHLPFRIGRAERDRWLEHMTSAVHEAGISPLDEAQLLTYFEATANHMVNATP